MRPSFLLPETVTRHDGASAAVSFDQLPDPVRLTLGITQIVPQESLEVSIWGSADSERWTELAPFPQKSYCGTYSLVLDIARHPTVRYLRAQWKMGRWANRNSAPLFGFYVFAEKGRLLQYAGAA